MEARPGRIDRAIEIGLPDADGRRLFALYSGNMCADVVDLTPYIIRTDGVSAAFIREVLRTAALIAAEEGQPGPVTAAHLDASLADLLLTARPFLNSLLGAGIRFETVVL